MKISAYTPFFLLLLFTSCNGQNNQQATTASANYNRRLAGGSCEGCEAVFEWGNKPLKSTDTLPDWNDKGPRLKLMGTIYEPNGKIPAKGVILYVYHTDQTGVYPTRGNETGWGRRHGYIRGWIKTGADGKYAFYTLKPGVYPQRNAPAHVHPLILEPDGKHYYIDEYLFAGDPLIPEKEKDNPAPKGGYGIITLYQEGDLLVGKRDIVLGKNISPYK